LAGWFLFPGQEGTGPLEEAADMIQRDRNRHNIQNPDVAISLFRNWCLREGIIPEHATIEQLHKFGNHLIEYGYNMDEVRNCEYIVFKHL